MNNDWIVPKEQVVKFVGKLKTILSNKNSLYIVKRDKNTSFMVKYNLQNEDVRKMLLSLDETNYSSTDNDRELARGGQVWIFGMSFPPKLIEDSFQIYIKLKIQSKVVCLSLHEAEYDLKYPYL